MSLLFDTFAQPRGTEATIRFLPDDPTPRTLRDLDVASQRAAAWLTNLVGRRGSVAAAFTTSFDCIATIFGAFRSGLRLVSLPHPARGVSLTDYQAQIELMCSLADASHLLVDPQYLPFVSDFSRPVHGYHEYLGTERLVSGVTEGTFVQFTSGSTRSPKGIELTLAAIEASISAMIDSCHLESMEVVCGWLPLSHDMGFVGLLLTPFCALNPPWSSRGDLVLIRPEAFVANPRIWLQACSDYKATFTAAPPFALRLVQRALAHSRRFDLSNLRSLVVGSEPVAADLLRSFADAAASSGFSSRAFSPAYGLAEATLGVTMVPRDRHWTSCTVDPAGLGRAVWTPTSEGREVVSCGPPLAGVDLRIAGRRAIGELEIRSPALLTGYLGSSVDPLSDDGWFRTFDLAHLSEDGQLYVLGRTDDVFLVAGLKVYSQDLEAVVAQHPLVRPGGGVVIPDGSDGYLVVIECRRANPDNLELKAACRDVRTELLRQAPAGPSTVIFTEHGGLPRTPSGKLRRNYLQELYRGGDLPVVASL